MINQEELRSRALRAYEFGRLRMSARVLLLILPLGAASTLLSTAPKTCAYLTLAIAALTVALRWLDVRGVQAVDTGLRSGTLPLIISVVLMQLGCPSIPSLCNALCLLTGTLAGLWTGYQLGRRRAGVFVWFCSVSVALSLTLLGSLDLGFMATGGLSVAYIVSATIVAALIQMHRAEPLR